MLDEKNAQVVVRFVAQALGSIANRVTCERILDEEASARCKREIDHNACTGGGRPAGDTTRSVAPVPGAARAIEIGYGVDGRESR